MDETTIRALISTAIAEEFAKHNILTDPKPADITDLSGYATLATVDNLLERIALLDDAMRSLAADVAQIVDRGDDTPDNKMLKLWLSRVLSKWFEADRPTDAELNGH